MKPWWVTGAWVLFALAAAVVELWPAEELIGIDDSSMETGRGWCLLLCAAPLVDDMRLAGTCVTVCYRLLL